MRANDPALMKFDFDFTGVQTYTRVVVKKNGIMPYLQGTPVSPKKRKVKGITQMKWEVYPEGIYRALKYYSRYPVGDIYITENGAAFKDILTADGIYDQERINFFREYLTQVLKAKKEGVNVKGYFVWSLLDNFEWAEGYNPRFGVGLRGF
jgi:beta-glucosidase